MGHFELSTFFIFAATFRHLSSPRRHSLYQRRGVCSRVQPTVGSAVKKVFQRAVLLRMKRATKYAGILIGECLLCSRTLSAAGAGDGEEDPSFSIFRLNIADSACSRVPFDSLKFIKDRPSSTISRVGWPWKCNGCAISISCYFAVVLAITFLMLVCFRTLGRSPTLTSKSRILGEDLVVENQCIVSPYRETPALNQTHTDMNAPSEFLHGIK